MYSATHDSQIQQKILRQISKQAFYKRGPMYTYLHYIYIEPDFNDQPHGYDTNRNDSSVK